MSEKLPPIGGHLILSNLIVAGWDETTQFTYNACLVTPEEEELGPQQKKSRVMPSRQILKRPSSDSLGFLRNLPVCVRRSEGRVILDQCSNQRSSESSLLKISLPLPLQ